MAIQRYMAPVNISMWLNLELDLLIAFAFLLLLEAYNVNSFTFPLEFFFPILYFSVILALVFFALPILLLPESFYSR